MQESRCVFVDTPPNLPIDQCNSTVSHPTLTSGHCVFYDMIKNSYATPSGGITVEYPTRHLYFLKGSCVYQKIQVTREIFHGIALKSVA